MKCLHYLAAICIVMLAAAAPETRAMSVSPGNAVEVAYEATKRALNKPCLVNANCYKSFFELENYCCGIVCCNFVEYIVRDK